MVQVAVRVQAIKTRQVSELCFPMRSSAKHLWSDQSGAIAVVYALALPALIAVGGIAFDFARMATLDTELQSAADQAALAAATQLDGGAGAIARATSAARNLISNETRFANDGQGRAIGVLTIQFFVDKAGTDQAENDTEANFVNVSVATRTANFALTPIVGAISESMNASAFAGVDSAICGVVPFFICSPTEPAGNTDPYYPVGVTPGVGIVMGEGGTQWGPGNFGYIETLGTGAVSAAEALASDALFTSCVSTDSNSLTQTGNILNAVRNSLNIRFDFDRGSGSACKSGPCSPSTNAMKDVVRSSGSCIWQQNPATATDFQSKRYRPLSNSALNNSITPQIMGHPRDICHSLGGTIYACPSGRIGTGVWDRAAYFRSNHPGLDWQNTDELGPTVSRYQTYLWEAKNIPARLPSKTGSGGLSAYSTPQTGQCEAPGLAPNPTGIDRRRISAAVVNCSIVSKTSGLNGKNSIPVAGFIDVFLVEPSIDRTKCDGNAAGCKVSYSSRNDVYVEAIGFAGTAEGGAVAQISKRAVPRLIR